MKNLAQLNYEKENEDYRRTVSTTHFLFNVLGTCLPFLLLFFPLLLSSRGNELLTPFLKGDFFLYSSSFWSATLFLSKEFEKKRRVGMIAVISQIAWFPIVLSAAMYTALYFMENASLIGIIILSTILTISGGILLYKHIRTMYEDITIPTENIAKISRENIDNLLEDLK